MLDSNYNARLAAARPCPALLHASMSCPDLLSLALPCPAQSCPALPCSLLPCPAQPSPAPPSPAQASLTMQIALSIAETHGAFHPLFCLLQRVPAALYVPLQLVWAQVFMATPLVIASMVAFSMKFSIEASQTEFRRPVKATEGLPCNDRCFYSSLTAGSVCCDQTDSHYSHHRTCSAGGAAWCAVIEQ